MKTYPQADLCTGHIFHALLVVLALFVAGNAVADGKPGYTGSARCSECHKQQAVSWSETLHSRFLRLPTNDATLAELQVFNAASPIAISHVAYVMGNMRKLVFLEKKNDKLVPMEHQYDIGGRAWEPFNKDLWDYHATGKKDDTSNKVNWYERCAGCHTTGYDRQTGTFTETSIGCEHCHGPGAKHADTTKRDDILNPASASEAVRIYVCAQCHSRGQTVAGSLPYAADFVPGADLSKTFTFDKPVPGKVTDMYWDNGAAKQHHSQFNELRQSKHFENGVVCFDCHQVHRFRDIESPSQKTRLMAFTDRFMTRKRSQYICLSCHDADSLGYQHFVTSKDGKTLDQHTHHPPAINTEGVTRSLLCSDCHMPRMERDTSGYNIHSHRFLLDTPQSVDKTHAPNACLQCHADKDRSWLVETLKNWQKKSK